MKKVFVFLVFNTIALTVFSQQKIVITNPQATKFAYNGKAYSYRQVVSLLSKSEDTAPYIKTAYRSHKISNVLGTGAILGGGVAIFNVLLGSKDTAKKTAFVGIGLGVISLPFSIISTRNAEKAIKIHNNNLAFYQKIDLRLNINTNAVGLKLNF